MVTTPWRHLCRAESGARGTVPALCLLLLLLLLLLSFLGCLTAQQQPKCISGTVLLIEIYVLPHYGRTCYLAQIHGSLGLEEDAFHWVMEGVGVYVRGVSYRQQTGP